MHNFVLQGKPLKDRGLTFVVLSTEGLFSFLMNNRKWIIAEVSEGCGLPYRLCKCPRVIYRGSEQNSHCNSALTSTSTMTNLASVGSSSMQDFSMFFYQQQVFQSFNFFSAPSLARDYSLRRLVPKLR